MTSLLAVTVLQEAVPAASTLVGGGVAGYIVHHLTNRRTAQNRYDDARLLGQDGDS